MSFFAGFLWAEGFPRTSQVAFPLLKVPRSVWAPVGDLWGCFKLSIMFFRRWLPSVYGEAGALVPRPGHGMKKKLKKARSIQEKINWVFEWPGNWLIWTLKMALSTTATILSRPSPPSASLGEGGRSIYTQGCHKYFKTKNPDFSWPLQLINPDLG